jgi:hypothetical protein
MRRQLVDAIAPPVYAVIDLLVVIAPAIAIKIASDRGGMGDAKGLDLLAASTLLGLIHALIAGRRLRSEERTAVRRADMWIAAVDALVVLTLAATVLPVVVLWGFSEEHASIARRGFPVVALWVGVQLVAIALAEVTGRVVFWWLEPHPRARSSLRQHLLSLHWPHRHSADVSTAGRPDHHADVPGSGPCRESA